MATVKGGFGSAIAETKLGKFGGFGLFLFATVMLFWNEGEYKKNRDTIQEAESVAVHVEDVSVADAQWEGQLIHGTAQAQTDEWVSDPLFGISVNAVRLNRNVRYYQWEEEVEEEEHTDSDGDTYTTTTYSYYKTWSSEPIDSDQFHRKQGHTNHVWLEIESLEKYADRVLWGAYTLPLFLKSAIDSTLPITIAGLPEALALTWKEKLAQSVRRQTQREPENDYLTVSSRSIYMGANPNAPAIGDVYIFFNYVPPGLDLSLIAQVEGSSFTKYTAKNGRTFHSSYNGVSGMAEMFRKEHADNASVAWALRITLLMCIIVALRSMFQWLPRIFQRIPVLGPVMHASVKAVCLILGLCWTLFVIALAWLFYRPVTSLILFGIILLFVWNLRQKGRKRAPKTPAGMEMNV
jgi:Protein of unknown function (DUF1625).